LQSKQEGLERLIAQLRHVDTIRAGEAHFDQLLADGRLTAANVRAFKKRLHAQAP
jgi:acyl dehydratase